MAKLKLHIELNSNDPNAVATVAKTKFNKLGFVSQEWDDGNFTGASTGKNLWAGYTYTDGCGNPRNYAGAIALNRGTGNPGDEGYDPNYVQVPQLRTLTSASFDVANHSFYHTDVNPLNQSVLLDGIIDLRMGYKMRVLVIPTNFTGYTHAAKLMGYVSSSGQGAETFDEYAPGINDVIPIDTVTNPIFFGLGRAFVDEWNNPTEVNNIKAEVLSIINGDKNFLVVGTHNPLTDADFLAGFTSFYNYVRDTSSDRLLICSTREALEYLEMRTMPIIQSVANNVLTIEIDITNLFKRNRWRDLSFNIQTTAQIVSVTTEGFTSNSFNPTTKLVNGFLQKDIWEANTSELIVPRGVFFLNSSDDFSEELNQWENWASNVYYGINGFKAGTDDIAVSGDSMGGFFEKKGTGRHLLFRGNNEADIYGRPPFLIKDNTGRGEVEFWNSPNLGYTTDDFRKQDGSYDYQYYSTGATLIMMRTPGQSSEAAINDQGGRFFVSELNGDFRVYSPRVDNTQRVITGAGDGDALPPMFQISSVHVEYIKDGTIGLWINNVFKGSIPNDIPEGTGNYGDIAKLRNALGVFTNCMAFRFYAYYVHYTAQMPNIIANRSEFLTNVGAKWKVGTYDPLPHPNNDIQLTYNTGLDRWDLNFTTSNETQQQIDNAEIRWYILTPNSETQGAFTPQTYIKTGLHMFKTEYQEIYDDNFSDPRPEHFWASAFIRLAGATRFVQSPYKSIYAPYDQ